MRKRPKQTTRLLKVTCPSCKYIARITTTWLRTGRPLCPCNQRPMRVVYKRGQKEIHKAK